MSAAAVVWMGSLAPLGVCWLRARRGIHDRRQKTVTGYQLGVGAKARRAAAAAAAAVWVAVQATIWHIYFIFLLTPTHTSLYISSLTFLNLRMKKHHRRLISSASGQFSVTHTRTTVHTMSSPAVKLNDDPWRCVAFVKVSAVGCVLCVFLVSHPHTSHLFSSLL